MTPLVYDIQLLPERMQDKVNYSKIKRESFKPQNLRSGPLWRT